MVWLRVGAASAAVCVVVAGCSSTPTRTEPQAKPTTADSVVASAPAKVDHIVGDQNAITFDFIYPEGDPNWTDEAKASLNDAADTLASYLVVPKPVTITYKLADDPDPTHLAQASSAQVDYETPGFFPTVVQKKLITGEDANGDQPDGDIDVNWKANWVLSGDIPHADEDSDAEPPADFKAVIMHEMGHTFGFDTNIQGPGSPPSRNRTVFDEFVVDENGTKVLNDDYTFNTAFEPNLTGGNGGLYFGGPHAMAAFGGKPVPLLTESEWNVSNICHLNGHFFTGENKKLMNSGNEAWGDDVRTLSPVELGIFEDLGYTVVQH